MFKRILLLALAGIAYSSSSWAQAPRGGSYYAYDDNGQADDSQYHAPRRSSASRQRSAKAKPPASQPVTDENNAAEETVARRYSQNQRQSRQVRPTAATLPPQTRPAKAARKAMQGDAPPPPPAVDPKYDPHTDPDFDQQFDLPANPAQVGGGQNNQPPVAEGMRPGPPYDAPWTGGPPLGGFLPPGGCGGCDSCGGDGCDDCGGCGRRPIYARAEYLSWWIRGDDPPPLVTTSPAGTAQGSAGQLGAPGTTVLFGGTPINNTQRSGARLTLGMWLNPGTRIEGEWFGLGGIATNYNASSAGGTILARPFFDMNPAVLGQDAKLLAYPGTFAGSVHASETSRFLGAGLNASYNVLWNDYGRRQHRIDFLYGFRYLRLSEGLGINDQITSLSGGGLVPAGTIFSSYDTFKATNNFYGLNLGVMSENRFNRLSFTTIGRLGVGSTVQHVTINGGTTVTSAGSSASYAGGLLAQPTNIGSYTHDAFTVVPQLELKLSYYFRPNLRAMVGYDLLYWSSVARPGQQVNTNVNTTQATGGALTGPTSPSYTLHQTDLWVQGISLGGEWTF